MSNRLSRAAMAVVLLVAAVVLAGCGTRPPEGTWVHPGDSQISIHLETEAVVSLDLGDWGDRSCLGTIKDGPFAGGWASAPNGWYSATFEDFTLDFTFDTWEGDPDYDTMYLSFCGDRDNTLTMARH